MSHTVFVTGSDGFLGRQLCPYLVEKGHQVRYGIQLFPDHPALPVDPGVFASDIGPDTDWREPLAGVDTVIHLAARVHIMQENAVDPLAAFRKVNTEGTRQLAKSAAELGVSRFIFISTIGVNGNSTPADQPFTETSPVAPHNFYAQSKWEAEQLLHQLAQDTGLEVVITRLPLVYGPGVPGNFLRLLKLANSGLPLPLGGINNRRSLLSRTNLVDFLGTCVESPDVIGETFLLSDDQDVTTSQLVQKIAHYLQRRVYLLPFPASLMRVGGRILGREHTIEQLWGSLAVDSRKARDVLGWHPPVSMDDELALTAAWFKTNR